MNIKSITQKKRPFLLIGSTIMMGLFLFALVPPSHGYAAPKKTQTVRVWLQTTDSCRQAVPGAVFTLHDNGTRIYAEPGNGKKTVTLGKGPCPVQQGNCLKFPVGCVSWLVTVPSSRTRTALITEKRPAPSYAICLGGSDCPHGTSKTTLKIDSAGRVSATNLNIYPNGDKITFPINRLPFTGTQTDPILVHNSRIGNGNCDGDNDADDHTTGDEGNSPRCDSDGDWKPKP